MMFHDKANMSHLPPPFVYQFDQVYHTLNLPNKKIQDKPYKKISELLQLSYQITSDLVL